MYTNYSNNYDTSHVPYPEGLTVEEQHTEWAIFVALQPPQADTHTIVSPLTTLTIPPSILLIPLPPTIA